MTNTENDYELSQEDKEMSFYTSLFNIFQTWYNKNIEPSYPAMIEDTNDELYTNGSLETFYDFLTEFKDNINNIAMTRIYDYDEFIYNKYNELYEEYYILVIFGETQHRYASPLFFSLLIFLAEKQWNSLKWNIEICTDDDTCKTNQCD